MKYLGERSLSSVMSVVLKIAWYVVLIGAIGGGLFLFAMLLFPLEEITEAVELQNDPDWQRMYNMPLALKILFVPYFALAVVLLLKIIRKCRNLFENFRNDVVFRPHNVDLIRDIGKILIVFSIITFQFGSLIVSLLLLLLCEVFKNGTSLQEEHDLTV
jgi:hypothetical protein